MIVIGNPFVSDFFIETIIRNNLPVIATREAVMMISDKSLNWISEKDALKIIKKSPDTLLYTNSENTFGWINSNIESYNLLHKIEVFKNKIKFRELLADIFPDYFFKGVRFEDLRNIDIGKMIFPFIIKPATGFFSIAVHKIDKLAEWKMALDKIDFEIENLKDLYPKEVINTKDFIIEECIQGEEYAVDCYFNKKGEPVVLNILHHIFSSEKDVSDRVYSTSKKIIEKYLDRVMSFLTVLGEKADLTNFPAHIEIRVDSNGTIIPIEVNPLRFGGWCTSSDLSWYAYGINSYEYFFSSGIPDWGTILKLKEGKKYNIIVLDNNSGIKENDIEYFDYERLMKNFEKPLNLRKINFREYPVFGFLFTETTDGNEAELDEILTSDLKRFIRLKNS